MNKRLWIIVVVIVVVLTATWTYSRPKQASGETVKIGAALCLTGICANWGEGELKAYRLAIDEANKNGGIHGKLITFISEDTGYDPKGITTTVQKLIQVDQVDAILGPTWGDSFQGGYSIINKARVVSVSPSSALESLFYNKQPVDYVFSTWFPEHEDVNAVQAYAQKMNLKRVIVLHDEDTFGAMMADLFDKQASVHGITVINEQKFPIGFDDFRTTIIQLKTFKPDAIFLSFQGPVTKAKFMKQAYELGFKTTVLSSTDIEDPSLIKDFGSVLNGIVYGFPNISGKYDEFAQKYKVRFGVEPEGPSAANAYDAANILIAALIEREKNGTDVKTALERTSVPGVAVAEVKFDQNHQLTDVTFIEKTIRDGQFVVVQ